MISPETVLSRARARMAKVAALDSKQETADARHEREEARLLASLARAREAHAIEKRSRQGQALAILRSIERDQAHYYHQSALDLFGGGPTRSELTPDSRAWADIKEDVYRMIQTLDNSAE